MADCIFCKIIKKEIPSEIVYEDNNILAFLDIVPLNKGHTLVIPKKHYENLEETDGETLTILLIAIKKISQGILKAVNAQSFNLLLRNKKDAGQIVEHIHFHIIPRFLGDGLRSLSEGVGREYEENEAKLIASKIKSFL